MPPHAEFRPGHNKWDMHYSIETYQPDLILQTWRLSPADRDFLRSAGYQRLGNGIYVKPPTPDVNIDALRKIPFPMRHLFETAQAGS
jgi:hypothetical protein